MSKRAESYILMVTKVQLLRLPLTNNRGPLPENFYKLVLDFSKQIYGLLKIKKVFTFKFGQKP